MNCSLDFFKLFSEPVVAHLWHKSSQVGNEELMTLQFSFIVILSLTCGVEDNEPADLDLGLAHTGRWSVKMDMMFFGVLVFQSICSFFS